MRLKTNGGRAWRYTTALCAVGTIALAAACGGGNSAGGGNAGGGNYTIGYSGDLSGSLASIGTGLRDGYATYFDQVNGSGGINGHQVTFLPLDDASDPTKGVANAKQLTQSEKVDGMFVFLSNIIKAMQPVLAATHTPAIVQAMPPELLHPPQTDIYAGDILIGDEPTPMFSFLAQKVGGSKPNVGIIAAQTAALSALVDNSVKLADAKGWPIADKEQVSLNSTSAAPQATALASKHPDVVVMALTDPLAISATQTLRRQGYKGAIVNYDGGGAYSTLQQLGDPDFYVVRPYAFAGSADSSLGVKQFEQAAKKANVDPNRPFVVNGYVQAYVMGQALKQCGYPCDASKLEKTLPTLNNVDTQGLTFGKWIYSHDDHSGIQTVKMFHWDTQQKAPVAATDILPM